MTLGHTGVEGHGKNRLLSQLANPHMCSLVQVNVCSLEIQIILGFPLNPSVQLHNALGVEFLWYGRLKVQWQLQERMV